MTKERYFIVLYTYCHNGSFGYGQHNQTGPYPNNTKTRESAARHLGCGTKDVVITNIIELSLEDFNSWNA